MKTPIISIFDLDGTLTKKDTYLIYLMGYILRHPSKLITCFQLPFALLLFFLNVRNNQWLKEKFLTVVLGGERVGKLSLWTEQFLKKILQKGLHLKITDILQQRLKAGDIIVLATASLDLYVTRFAELLNIRHVICTGVKWNGDVLTGQLNGPNCYGQEKLERVKEYLSKKKLHGEIHTYTDHHSDIPLLRYSTKQYAVFPTKKLRQIAVCDNYTIVD